MNRLKPLIVILLLFVGCNKSTDHPWEGKCSDERGLDEITTRNFEMGFSTWSFGPDANDQVQTYRFIQNNATIYSEQFDDKIPWNAWINHTALPEAFTKNVNERVGQRLNNQQLLLSVSLLNSGRNGLLEDYDGSIPEYRSLSDSIIANAYFKHLEYLVLRLNPDYLVMAMEVNELKLHDDAKWNAYQQLMGSVRSKLRKAFPHLQLAESVTLHNWFLPDVENEADFIAEISDYVNQYSDFAAISYYPFFKGQHNAAEFQQAFDFLHEEITIPVAFVETTHLAENLTVESYDLSIDSDVCEQKAYLETLLLNAYRHNYPFIIWWAHRDFDQLWNAFPLEYQDLAKLWRDTGLLDEDGVERPSYQVWRNVLEQ